MCHLTSSFSLALPSTQAFPPWCLASFLLHFRATDVYLVPKLAIQFPASAPDLWETRLQRWPLPVQHQQPSVGAGSDCSSQQCQGATRQGCQPGAWKGNRWEKGLFILTTLSFSFLIIITYFTKNSTMEDQDGLLFDPSRKEDHIAPGGAPVSWSAAGSILTLLSAVTQWLGLGLGEGFAFFGKFTVVCKISQPPLSCSLTDP